MSKYYAEVTAYLNFDPNREKSVDEISSHFGWKRHSSYIYKYFLSKLNADQVDLLKDVKEEISLDIIAAICIQNKKYTLGLLQNINRITIAVSPFTEIDLVIDEIKGIDPLSKLGKGYWFAVYTYLGDRQIDSYPFNKKTINFLKQVSVQGYASLSANQKKWLLDLIEHDKKRPEADRFFINEYLLQMGFAKECTIIENY